MKKLIMLLVLLILPLTLWSQLNYPVQKVTTEGDTLVIFTKSQADRIKTALQEQKKAIKDLTLQYKKLKYNHISLIEEYALVKKELNRTISYNDSLMNHLGENMALLYKTNDSSDVYYLDLKYYKVDVFKKGTIFLTSMNEKEREKLNLHLSFYPEWKFINIYNELNSEYRSFVDTLRLYNHLNEQAPTVLKYE